MAAAHGFAPALFDQLPAPMRNQIYGYLLRHTPRLAPGSTQLTTGMTFSQILEAGRFADFASQTPQLRLEMFRLLEISMETRRVPFTLLKRYLQFWEDATPNQNRDIRIEIDLNRSFATAQCEVDMYPLLMRCRRNPRMKISIRAHNTTYRNAKQTVALHEVHGNTTNATLSEAQRVIKFKRFFKMCMHRPPKKPHDPRRWYNYFGQAVEGLRVQFQVNNDGLFIDVKRRYTPDWMVSGIGSSDRGAPWMLEKQKNDWKVNAGLSEFKRTVPETEPRGETWPLMQVKGGGYNAAGLEE